MTTAPFAGFGPGLVEFFTDLETHNEREWFKANRARYDEQVGNPLKALAAVLEPAYGPVHIFRPYRNARFGGDRPPLHEYARLGAGAGGPGLFLQVDADGLFLGGGLWHAARPVLDRFRHILDRPEAATVLHRQLDAWAGAGYRLQAPTLTGPPRGYRRDHPEIDLLRVTNLVVGAHWASGPWLSTAQALERIRTGWDVVSGWNGWLTENLSPTSP